jgi:hypothetical protein
VVVKTRNTAAVALALLVEPWKRFAGGRFTITSTMSRRSSRPLHRLKRLKAARRRADIEEGAVEARIANALVDIREARGRSWTDSTRMR